MQRELFALPKPVSQYQHHINSQIPDVETQIQITSNTVRRQASETCHFVVKSAIAHGLFLKYLLNVKYYLRLPAT